MRFDQSVRYATISDIGLRRQNNEDATTVRIAPDKETFDRYGHLFVVADGMGGHAVGELASRMCTESLPQAYLKSRDIPPMDALREAIRTTNEAINEKGSANRDFERMGTTCTGLVLGPGGAFIGHVGDTRCYRIRRGRINQLTFDHSLQWEMARRRGISIDVAEMYEPRNVITRSLGPEPEVEIDVEGPFAILSGDVYVLCTDGLTSHVTDPEIGAIAGALPANDACRMLVNLANIRGGSDNVSVSVVTVGRSASGLTEVEEDDPTEPINPIFIGLAWVAAAFFLLGIVLLLFGKFLSGVIILGLTISTIAAISFRYWQVWFRQSQETTLHGTGVARRSWKAYRAATAKVTPEFVRHLAQIESELHRAAKEEGWPIPEGEHEGHYDTANAALNRQEFKKALSEFASAIDILMKGMHIHRRGKRMKSDEPKEEWLQEEEPSN
ncbi:PP2C family protein-serine/threonine phosphatase [Calycomorphotria hydatis]|uniref:PPM-type phosphatase domain-containing protein n=1 Tax=Calycomorphotria hydatis TaxID=2528027 RepID=A0A517TAR2_9PLAN|nr:protein phosphatase 2C domain-containing protein [Calycomorphotria hydatis]QDT65458.1 Putative protein phosphatase 2C-type [Calycomorphotria hydatis]